MSSKTEKRFKCEECGKYFSSERTLREHVRYKHKKQLLYKKRFMVCPLCDKQCCHRQELLGHLIDIHEIEIQFERKEFSNMTEFLEWKENMEKETKSQYVLKRGVRTLADQSKKLYYHCCRSGDYEQDKKAKSIFKSSLDDSFKKKSRRMKLQGSRRIGKLCPATLEVIYNNDKVTALFWSTHIGHTNDLKHCTLSKSERSTIATKLAEGKTVDSILNDVKSATPSDAEQLTRAHMITRKDVNNIRQQRALNDANRLLIYVESESHLQNEVREKAEEIRRLCDSTVYEEETCKLVTEHLNSAIKILAATQEGSVISSIIEGLGDDQANKQNKFFSVRRKRKINTENPLQYSEVPTQNELPIIVRVEDDSIAKHIANDHCY